MMLTNIIITLALICVTLFIFVAPYKLSKKKIKIKPNLFDSFVDNDEGYIWSTSSERKKSYKNKIER